MNARCLALSILTVLAGPSAPCSALEEHDAAKAAVTTRSTMSLEAIVDRVGGEDTQVLDARLEQIGDGYRYHLKLLEQGHRVRRVVVDGRTGAIVEGE